MRVRTIRTHSNEHGASYEKLGSAGAIYDVPEDEGRRLIKFGFVEKADSGSGKSKGATKGAAGTGVDGPAE